MYYAIYKIINKMNGKIYIGAHKTKHLDDKYMGSGKYLKHAQEKHGIENFSKEILFVFDNPAEMYAKEAEIITAEFLAEENTYNLKLGGFGGFDYINSNPGKFLTEKRLSALMPIGDTQKLWKQKFNTDQTFKKRVQENALNANRISLQNNPNGTFFGKKHCDETKKIIGKKNSKSQSGGKNSQFGTMWITNGIDNKKIRKDSLIPDNWKKGRIVKK